MLLPVLGLEATGVGFFLMYVVYLPLVYWMARLRTGFRWSKTVARDLFILFTLAVVVSLVGTWGDIPGALFGMVAAIGFGVNALMRLVTMASLGGLAGKLAVLLRRIFLKKG